MRAGRAAAPVFVLVLLLAAACAGTSEGTAVTTIPPATTTTEPAGEGLPSPVILPGSPVEWEAREVTLAGASWTVAVADTADLRARGLMGVTDLGPVDGMLFVYPEPVESRFWMRDTLLALDIAFFDDSGGLLTVLAMEPCDAAPCPLYDPEVPFRWALETLPGRFSGFAPGARLVVGD